MSAYFHWGDRPALAQALTVMKNHQINPDKVKDFILREANSDELVLITDIYGQVAEQNLSTMQEVEDLIFQEWLERKTRPQNTD